MTNAMNPLVKGESKDNIAVQIKDEAKKSKENNNSEKSSDDSYFVFVVWVMLVFTCILFFDGVHRINKRPILSEDTKKFEASLLVDDQLLGGHEGAASVYTPEQLHLSLGSSSSELYITWTTDKALFGEAYVEICKLKPGSGCAEDVRNVTGVKSAKTFESTDEKWNKVTLERFRTINTYRAKVEDLELGALYSYRAVSSNAVGIWRSKTYQFKAYDFQATSKTARIGFFGDLGLVNGQSIPHLVTEVDLNNYDILIHNGDFAYDLDTHHGQYGDEFMRKIEPIAARVPYQTSVGNHEAAANFSHYDHRFTMVNSGGHDDGEMNNFYYSFNVGPIHFIAFSTEFYYYRGMSGMEALDKQYKWIEKDLKLASSPEERAKRPWIFVFGHRPMYCSSRDRDDCTKDTDILRRGLPKTGAYALEKLFYDYGVDVQLYSHEHMYERFLPIYDGKVFEKNESNPYFNPQAPVHIISGSAGCQERLDPFKNKSAPGSVKQISDYGFLRIEATRCKVNFIQLSTDSTQTLQRVDEFTIEKTKIQNFPTQMSASVLDCMMEDDLKDCYRGWVPDSCTSFDGINEFKPMLTRPKLLEDFGEY